MSPKGKGRRRLLTEEGVVERHRFDALHVQIIEQIRVQVEENGHVDRLAGVEPLLLEAEALDLAEVGCALRRGDAVGGNANDVLVPQVGGLVEGQGRLAGQDAHLALLGHELPGQRIRDGGVEGDLDALCRGDGDDTGRDVGGLVGAGAVGTDGLAAPASGLADLVAVSGSSPSPCGELFALRLTILYMGTEP